MRRRIRPMRALAAIVLAAAIVCSVGACGGDSTSDAGAEKATTTAASSATSFPAAIGDTAGTTATAGQTPPGPADVVLSESALLTVEDLPTGWKADPSPSNESSFDYARIQEVCPAAAHALDGLSAHQGLETAKAHASFRLGDQGLPGIQSSVLVSADVEIAGQGYITFTSESFRSCLLRILTTNIEAKGFTPGEPLTALLPIDAVGDEAEAVRVTVPISAYGTQVLLFFDYVVIRVDKVLQILIIGSADLFPMPYGTETQAIAAAADFAA